MLARMSMIARRGIICAVLSSCTPAGVFLHEDAIVSPERLPLADGYYYLWESDDGGISKIVKDEGEGGRISIKTRYFSKVIEINAKLGGEHVLKYSAKGLGVGDGIYIVEIYTNDEKSKKPLEVKLKGGGVRVLPYAMTAMVNDSGYYEIISIGDMHKFKSIAGSKSVKINESYDSDVPVLIGAANNIIATMQSYGEGRLSESRKTRIGIVPANVWLADKDRMLALKQQQERLKEEEEKRRKVIAEAEARQKEEARQKAMEEARKREVEEATRREAEEARKRAAEEERRRERRARMEEARLDNDRLLPTSGGWRNLAWGSRDYAIEYYFPEARRYADPSTRDIWYELDTNVGLERFNCSLTYGKKDDPPARQRLRLVSCKSTSPVSEVFYKDIKTQLRAKYPRRTSLQSELFGIPVGDPWGFRYFDDKTTVTTGGRGGHLLLIYEPSGAVSGGQL